MISVNKNQENKYCFKLKAISGKVLLTSISFQDKKEASKNSNFFKKIGPKNLSFERKTNFEGKFLYNLKNEHGNLIGQSQLYSSEAGLENGITNLKKTILSLSKKEIR